MRWTRTQSYPVARRFNTTDQTGYSVPCMTTSLVTGSRQTWARISGSVSPAGSYTVGARWRVGLSDAAGQSSGTRVAVGCMSAGASGKVPHLTIPYRVACGGEPGHTERAGCRLGTDRTGPPDRRRWPAPGASNDDANVTRAQPQNTPGGWTLPFVSASLSFPPCRACGAGDLVPVSTGDLPGAASSARAWVCTNPLCGAMLSLDDERASTRGIASAPPRPRSRRDWPGGRRRDRDQRRGPDGRRGRWPFPTQGTPARRVDSGA